MSDLAGMHFCPSWFLKGAFRLLFADMSASDARSLNKVPSRKCLQRDLKQNEVPLQGHKAYEQSAKASPPTNAQEVMLGSGSHASQHAHAKTHVNTLGPDCAEQPRRLRL